jgi:hypothetical protein
MTLIRTTHNISGETNLFTYSKQIPIIATPDVLVCGAGLAGIGAAVAAARNGARTLVIERLGFAGGFFTAIIGSAFDGFVDERTGTPVVGGIVFEMLERMGVVAPGQGPHLRYNVNGDLSFVEMHPERVIPRCDPERFKRAADDILTEAGVQILYHTQVTDVVARDGRVETVLVSNKAGLVAIQPKMVIDCTGDGDVAAWAGAPYEKAEPLQPMSLHFRLAYLQPSFELRRRCAAVLQAAQERGELGLYGGPYPATFSGRDVYFNATRFPGDSTNPDDWTQAEIQGRKDAWTMFNLWKAELPEFAESYFMASGPTAGARESRRIVGDYVLTGDDVVNGRATTTFRGRRPTTSPTAHCCRARWTTSSWPGAAIRPPQKRWPPAGSRPRRWAWVRPRGPRRRWRWRPIILLEMWICTRCNPTL